MCTSQLNLLIKKLIYVKQIQITILTKLILYIINTPSPKNNTYMHKLIKMLEFFNIPSVTSFSIYRVNITVIDRGITSKLPCNLSFKVIGVLSVPPFTIEHNLEVGAGECIRFS